MFGDLKNHLIELEPQVLIQDLAKGGLSFLDQKLPT